jgi:aryl-alcohol dehydrogenase-like predicted oxidoreductase
MVDLVRELDRLIASGKLRAWGVLNWPAEAIQEAVDVARQHGWRLPSAAQLAYSVLTRSPVEDARMVTVCENAGIGIVASYTLCGGLLSGKYRSADASAGGRLSHRLAPRLAPLLPKIDPFLQIAGEVGCTPSQLAIAYCLTNPQVSSVLFGARSVSQVQENVGALGVVPRLTPEVRRALQSL